MAYAYMANYQTVNIGRNMDVMYEMFKNFVSTDQGGPFTLTLTLML
jgi:hypothetical protein